MNHVFALTLTIALAGCAAYDRSYYEPGAARSTHLRGDEEARHAHMDAEREHLRQEEADEARRHSFGY